MELVESKYWEFWNKNHQFENDINVNWKWYSWMAINPFWANFGYNNNELKVRVHGNEFSYKKYSGDLKLTKDSYEGNQVLGESGDVISAFYDECLKYSDFNTQNSEKIKSLNSIFFVNINNEGIDLFLENGNFKMHYRIYRTYSSKYSYDCNSNNVISIFRDKEDEILKRIFVKIEDCPQWSHPLLKEVREKQLSKEKRLKLVRRIIPFIKNN